VADNNGKKSIEERLDAVAMNLELLSHQSETHDRQIAELRESINRTEAAIARTEAAIAQTDTHVNNVVATVDKLAALTENMAWALSAHEGRIAALEVRAS
jgi:septal ring factor EnvC (AmiA/AmiB activator)